jgi:pyruvate dehydrogenase E2 component (dihydrolipoamide acetyltransferase)
VKISFWYVDVGERVGEGDNLVQVLTDKATFDVPAPVGGMLLETRAAENDDVTVGAVIAVLETDAREDA